MMRFEFDNNGYVSCILYGCYTGSCCEYSGLVPSEPEAYEDMDDWANRAKVQAYYLNDQGNLTYDADKAASLPEDGAPVIYTVEDLERMGFKSPIQRMISEDAALAAWPPGSVYFETFGWNPETWAFFEGSTWEEIECGIPGVYAWKRIS